MYVTKISAGIDDMTVHAEPLGIVTIRMMLNSRQVADAIGVKGRRFNCAKCFAQIPYDQEDLGLASVTLRPPDFFARRLIKGLLLCTNCAKFKVKFEPEDRTSGGKGVYCYEPTTELTAGLGDLIKLYVRLEKVEYFYVNKYIQWGRKYLVYRETK